MTQNVDLALFQSGEGEVSLSVSADRDTVWLTQAQMAELFGKECSVITRHVGSVFREGELGKEGNVQKMHIAGSDKPVALYNLDVIISVGYRVKSQRGVEFCRWATDVLMCSLSDDRRRVTRDIDLDFIRCPLTDEGAHSFFGKVDALPRHLWPELSSSR